MQEILSTNSQKQQSKVLPWCSIEFDWPYEEVLVQVTVTAPREPNIFEWVIGRILQEFDSQWPSFDEAADELGFKDPVFLIETLAEMIKSGVIELKDSAKGLDFSNCNLTSLGQQFLNDKRTSDFPERHGLKVYFDTATCKPVMQSPARTSEKPENPLVSVGELPRRKTHIGLNRIRQLAKEQDEPFVTAESKITDAKVQFDQGRHVWAPVKAALGIDANGAAICQLDNATNDQQQWFEKLDFAHKSFGRIFTGALFSQYSPMEIPEKAFPEWFQSVEHLIPPETVTQQAVKIVSTANDELFISAYWLNAPEIKRTLINVANDGIHCTVYSRNPQPAQNIESLPESIDFIEADGPLFDSMPIVIVADQAKAISLDRVSLTTSSGSGVEIIIPSFVQGFYALQLYQELSRRCNAA